MKSLFSLLAVTTIGLSATSCNINNIVKTPIEINMSNVSNTVPIRLSKDVPLLAQKRESYCLPASIDMVFQFFDLIVDQDTIMNGIEHNVYNAASYMNAQLSWRLPNGYAYNLVDIPAGFGSNSYEMAMFSAFVAETLQRDMPIIFGLRNDSTAEGHVVVITSADIDINNPENSLYHVNDSGYPTTTWTIRGSQLAHFFAGGSFALSSSREFDFINRKVKIQVQEQKRFDRLSDNDKVSLNYNVNFGGAGFISADQLHFAKNIEFPDLTLNENWNGKSDSYSGDSWNPKNITGNQPWVEWTHWEYLNVYWFATGKLSWWDSTKVISQGLNNTVIDFQYEYTADITLSSSTMDVRLNYGNTIIIDYNQ